MLSKTQIKTFESFKKFKALVEKQSECSIKTYHSYRGCEQNDIHKELTVPYTLEQNGVAERKNEIMVETARSMMATSGISKEF